MRLRLVGIGLVVLLSMAPGAHALTSQRGVAQYAHTHYMTRDGLPHALVNSIAQTPDGYLWTGSEQGLARFDGARFTTFDHSKTPGLPTNQITVLAVDPEGGLWAGTREHGVVRRIDGRSLGTFFHEEFAEPLGLDFWIGLPEELEPRVTPAAPQDRPRLA